ncbi:MAG TPA: NAD(+) synthase, partial [Kofleriaceae bacterium]|nr:NAD(+) synthase [Kofleriaceae bacterium]
MKLVRVGAAVLNQTPLDWDGNRRRIEQAIAAAGAAGVSILCLPELCVSGYGCEDAFHSPGLQRTALEVLLEIAPTTGGMIACAGLPLFYNRALYNAVALLVDGRVAGFAAKRNLAGDGIYYEPRWFKPWPEGHVAHFEVGGCEVPLGAMLFDCGGVKIGFEVCEDAWVANRPGGHLALEGADVILNPSASHFAFGKDDVRQRFVIEGSRAFGVAYIYANLLGNEAGRIIYDGGALIASAGHMVAMGERFTHRDFELTHAVVDIADNRMIQARIGSFQPEVDDRAVDIPFSYPDLDPVQAPVLPRSWEQSERVQEEEFTRAVALGLFDYLRKSRSGGFAVSLSGGADSAAVSCLVALMVHLAVGQLGLDGFKARLPHIDLSGAATPRDLVGRLLTCAYQSTRNSGPVTRNAARAVAEAVGARYLELDVDAMVEGYTGMVSRALGRHLTWSGDDVALQNVQARARAPGIWMLANLENALLLATSNRSEAAVGYATMDGDTAGGLSPIAGIDKAFLRRWLVWLEREGPAGMFPIPALSAVTAQAPTAELRPPDAGQTDEKDLMPYDLLDAIEDAAIRDRHTPVEVFQEMRVHFPDIAQAQLVTYVERFFRLWCRNQWKRERYAPSFHLDDKNLDPKTWCRFPILSGGFERELAELRDYAAS